jgi:cardiolipin synthase
MRIKRPGPSAPEALAPSTQEPAPKPAQQAPLGTTAVSTVAPAAPVWGARPASAAAPVEAFRSSTFEASLDRDTASRNVAGNQVQLLLDGVHSFAERDAMIAGAKSSICLQTFIFNSDDTGWKLAHALADKAQAGVKVRVIYDAVGSGRSDPKLFELMKQAGVELRPYGEKWQVWELNDRWHEKHLIVDGQASVEGGMNVANEYALGGTGQLVTSRAGGPSEAWRDIDLKLQGPAVADATSAFLRNWSKLGDPVSDTDRAALFPSLAPVAGGSNVRVVQASPTSTSLDRTTERLYLDAITTAQKSITIENAYFLPPPEVRDALIAAAKRGVDVRVMTNSRTSSDMSEVADAARYFYDDMLDAGVRINEKLGGTLHAKTATFDGQFSIVGSVNLNGRSTNLDAEDALAVEDETTAKQLEQRFADGLSSTTPVTSDELQHEGFVTNLKQWALSQFAWTF